ncbi:hypothetical protein [Cellulomonas citrea]|uniref:hypothetical protein n=1 Tax=Cellulomonas citrea TaxID=1909423 RepID=UPI001358358E|nr:hypothetical protein [Cellulomonas citrea]
MRAVVLCPAGAVTGGPEALHQLVHTARALGEDAEIVYLGDGDRTAVPEPYRHYDVRIGTQVPDEPGIVVVAPEIFAFRLLTLQRAVPALWWLSVDWFDRHNDGYQRQYGTPLKPLDVLYGRPGVLHLAQSQYALDTVRARGGDPIMLSDYLHTSLRAELVDAQVGERADAVAYNPAKGMDTTRRLMDLAPDLTWVPLAGMTHAELARALGGVKAYVDFGEHPGRDRIPREAALAGACVVVGRRGSAVNDVDVPIPQEYKVDPAEGPAADRRTVALLRDVLADHTTHAARFASYRRWIEDQEAAFADETRGVFEAARSAATVGASA